VAREETIHADAVRAELRAMLGSSTFFNAARLRRFLAFVVEHTLRGEGAELKEYVIALGVFERPGTFEPQSDSVVRVEARRLRAKLDQYYAGEGRHARIRIEIPKGSYRPVFRHVTPVSPPGRRLGRFWARWRRGLAGFACGLLVAGAGVGGWLYWEHARAEIDSVAVLPFESGQLDPGLRYYGEGLAEMLIESLSTIPGLRVMGSASALKTGDSGQAADVLARRLGVRAVIRGALAQRGDMVRVTVSMSGADGRYVWSGSYDKPPGQLPGSEREILRDVVQALGLDGRRVLGAFSSHLSDASAEQSYLLGRYLLNRRGAGDVRRSVTYFEDAVARDPGYGPPRGALAAAYAQLSTTGPGPANEWLARAREAALAAIGTDSRLAEPHAVLGWIRFFHDWNWPAAEQELARARTLSPNNAAARQWYGLTRMALGRFGEAERELETAVALDPLAAGIRADLGWCHYFARRHARAAAAARQVAELEPGWPGGPLLGAAAESEQGRHAEALAWLERVPAGEEWERLARLAVAALRAGRREQAAGARSKLGEAARQGPGAAYRMAQVEAAFGIPEAALEWLEKAAANREPPLVYLNVDPLLDGLRSAPRFQSLLRRLNLAERGTVISRNRL
jgi:TolB-like protein/Tfp pilus assembly protein PilF